MLERLRQITQEVNQSGDMRESLHIVVNKVCDALNVEVCSIYLADYQAKQFVLMATQGLNPRAVGISTLGFNEGIVGLVASREEPLNLEDAVNHPNFHYLPEAGEEKFRAFLGVPIIHQRRVLGVLVVQQKAQRQFSNSEETFAITLSAQLAGVIASAGHREQIAEFPQDPYLIRKLEGVAAANGIAIGQAMVFYPPTDLSAIPDKKITAIDLELKRFKKALKAAKNEVASMKARMQNSLSDQELGLFDAYMKILDEKGIGADVLKEIENGHWAPGALRRVVEKHVRVFESMDDLYFRERSTDLIDLARRVLLFLEHDQPSRPQLDRPVILVAEEITAATLAELPIEMILGVVSMRGSTTSHAAILAKALGIPSVSGFSDVPINRFEGQDLIVDGYLGLIYISPSSSLKAYYEHMIREEALLSQELEKDILVPAITLDNVHVPLMVNTGLMADFEKSLHVGADGVGLYRTEIPFLLRDQFPSEQEQIQIYRAALKAFDGKTVTFRTLDIGGDKQLPYFPIIEENPFLGWRGIRVTLDHPEIFLVQARAIFKAAQGLDNVRIALPMISNVDEVDESLRLLRQAFQEVKNEVGEQVKLSMPDIGIILEVPSAIYQLEAIAKRVQFISVGSNDLAQYLLAVDRNNTRVSSLYSNYHPALICALSQVTQLCQAHQIELNICGEMAGDPMVSVLLLGLGFHSLSMNARSLPKVKKVIRNFSVAEAQSIVKHVLTLERAKETHAYLFEILESKGLGGLIRAGR